MNHRFLTYLYAIHQNLNDVQGPYFYTIEKNDLDL